MLAASLLELALAQDSQEVVTHQHLAAFEEFNECLHGSFRVADQWHGFQRIGGRQR